MSRRRSQVPQGTRQYCFEINWLPSALGGSKGTADPKSMRRRWASVVNTKLWGLISLVRNCYESVIYRWCSEHNVPLSWTGIGHHRTRVPPRLDTSLQSGWDVHKVMVQAWMKPFRKPNKVNWFNCLVNYDLKDMKVWDITNLESRNHLSVPRRSERDAIASLYEERIAGVETRIPKGGRMEDSPLNEAGGGESILCKLSLRGGLDEGNKMECK